MRVKFIIAFFALAVALSARADTSDTLADEAVCTPTCSGMYPWCHSCLDGSKACLSSAFGVCCGCRNGRCWSCDYASLCHQSMPNQCASLDGGGVAGVVVGCIVFVGLVILVVVCCCRHRHRWSGNGGYSEVIIAPAPIVPVGVSYGYDHHSHHHHHGGGAVGVGYQVGGGSSAVGVGYQVGGGNSVGVGYQVH